MERDLFDWDNWDYGGEGTYIFYNPVLKVQMGMFPAGTSFNTAQVDYQNGVLEFTTFTETGKTVVVASFKLTLNFGEI